MSEGLVVDSGALPTYTLGQNRFLSLDTSGRLITVGTGGGGATVVNGTDAPADNRANPTANVAVTAFNEYWDPNTETWFRVGCLDLNNESIAPFPDPFYALVTYAVSGGLDALTDTYSVFCQRSPADDMANPETDFLLPLDVVNRALLFCPENPLLEDSWLRARGDSLGNARTIASAPPLEGNEGEAERIGFASDTATRQVIEAAPVKLLSLDITCTAADAVTYLMFFDDDVAANNGDTPIPGMTFALPQGFFCKPLGREHFGEAGVKCDVGLTFAFSSTPNTLTVIAGSVAFVSINGSARV